MIYYDMEPGEGFEHDADMAVYLTRYLNLTTVPSSLSRLSQFQFNISWLHGSTFLFNFCSIY